MEDTFFTEQEITLAIREVFSTVEMRVSPENRMYMWNDCLEFWTSKMFSKPV